MNARTDRRVRRCPVCASDDLEWQDYPEDLEGEQLSCPVRCLSCGSTWEDVYQFVQVRTLTPGRRPSAPPTD